MWRKWTTPAGSETRLLITALGWQPDDRTDVEVLPDAAVVRRTPQGRSHMDSRDHVFLPTATRTLLNVPVGGRVVLLAVLDQDLLMIHPSDVVSRTQVHRVRSSDDTGVSASSSTARPVPTWPNPRASRHRVRSAMTTAPATLRAARLLLHQLGVTPEQLQWEPVPCPTIADYLPTVIAATGPGARRTYGTYWRRIAAVWGDQQLDQLTPSQIDALIQQPVPGRVPRRNTRGGTSAHEHLVAAIRAIYTHATSPTACSPHTTTPPYKSASHTTRRRTVGALTATS